MQLNMTVKDAYGWLIWILCQIAGVGLLILFANAVLSAFGFNVPHVPVLDFEKLAWAAGGWLALRYKGIS